jgi:hypothetical protein
MFGSVVFGSVVAVVFQSVFYLKINQDNFFFIFKKLFLISAHQINLKIKKILISSKKNKKFSNFFKSAFEMQKQIAFYKT